MPLSSRLTAQLCGAKFYRCCHSLQRRTFAWKSAGRTSEGSILSSGVSLLEPDRVESGLRLFPVSSFLL